MRKRKPSVSLLNTRKKFNWFSYIVGFLSGLVFIGLKNMLFQKPDNVSVQLKQDLADLIRTNEETKSVFSDIGELTKHKLLQQKISDTTGKTFTEISKVYIILGGGPGDDQDNGFPPWTEDRVTEALSQ